MMAPRAAVEPRAPQAAPKPAAPVEKKPQAGGLFDGWRNPLDGLRKLAGPEITPERRAALEDVRRMLEPDKLGGADRTFDFADRDAIVRGLMRDTPGLSRETQAQLRGEGKPLQANLVDRAFSGANGPIARRVRDKVHREAPPRVAGQLSEGLRDAGVRERQGATPDTTPRNVTFDELRRFEKSAGVLGQMQREVGDRLGVDISFPGGISQAAIDFTLSGRLGLPPGAVMTPRSKR